MKTLTGGLVIGNMSIVYSVWLRIITYVDSLSSMTNGQMDEFKAEITNLRTVNDHVDNETGAHWLSSNGSFKMMCQQVTWPCPITGYRPWLLMIGTHPGRP
jgi:hypothetical protein